MTRRDLPLLRGKNDGDWLRREGPDDRGPPVLLLLALRTAWGPVRPRRGLHRPGGLREGPRGRSAPHGGLPRACGGGVRPTPGEVRAVRRRGFYLYIEAKAPEHRLRNGASNPIREGPHVSTAIVYSWMTGFARSRRHISST